MPSRSSDKKSVNLSINTQVLAEAKNLKLNLSRTFEMLLEDYIRQRKAELWKQTNQESIKAYNQRIEEQDVFSKELRNF